MICEQQMYYIVVLILRILITGSGGAEEKHLRSNYKPNLRNIKPKTFLRRLVSQTLPKTH